MNFVVWNKEDRKTEYTVGDKEYLARIKAGILQLDPDLNEACDLFCVAVLLIAAALISGPWVDRIVDLTGYSRTFVSAVARRMRGSNLWADDDSVSIDWLNADGSPDWAALWPQILVGQGRAIAWKGEDGAQIYGALPPEDCPSETAASPGDAN